MLKVRVFILKLGVLSSLLCSTHIAAANNNIDYNAVDVGALQSQYQSELKPKTRKKVAIRKPANRKQISNNELLRYQKLLAVQQPVKQQTKRVAIKRPLTKPVRQVQRQAQQQRQPRIQKNIVSIPQAAVPRRDAIFEAATTGNVRLIGQLISQGVNVNQANRERETALHMAAAKGHYSAVIYLLNHGANINARTINNWLPIHHATRFRHAQIANYLKQKGSPIYAKTSDGLSAVDMAKALNDRRILGIFGVR